MAASVSEPPTAIKALLHPFIPNPISISCAKAPSLKAGTESAVSSFSSSSGTKHSSFCGPLAL